MGPKKASGWVNYEVLGIWGSEDWEVGTVVGRCGQSGEIPRPAFRSCPRPCSTNLGPYNFENLGLKFLKTDWRFLRKTIDPEGFLVIQLFILPQMFIDYLLCAGHFLGTTHTAMNKTDKTFYIWKFTF